MKDIPVRNPNNGTGRTYWRSLDELAETPEFRQWERSSRGGRELTDRFRAAFCEIMSACSCWRRLGHRCRRPSRRFCPSKLPDTMFTVSALRHWCSQRECHPLVVKSNDGRPTKIEEIAAPGQWGCGPLHAASISILRPDRAMVQRAGSAHGASCLDLWRNLQKPGKRRQGLPSSPSEVIRLHGENRRSYRISQSSVVRS
jgi:molybdopterin-containing oxidoreductase family iron-sulfur binding subunit